MRNIGGSPLQRVRFLGTLGIFAEPDLAAYRHHDRLRIRRLLLCSVSLRMDVRIISHFETNHLTPVDVIVLVNITFVRHGGFHLGLVLFLLWLF